MTDALLDIRQVTKTFPTPEGGVVVALDSVDLAVTRGQFFVMLGPSGCGKTSLLRCIAGLEYPNSGEILLDGSRIDDIPAYDRPVNTVFQSYALFPHMSVAQNVAFGLEMEHLPKSEIRSRVAAALEQVKLTGLDRRKPTQLSGGQQQRVALARALAKQPKVLLLDEPLSALDLKLRRGMQVELKRLQRETGITFVFVTHDQEEAMTMGDRIAVFNEGKIVQVGSPQDIYRKPVNGFVADFIGETNLIKVSVGASGLTFPGGGVLARELLADDCEVPAAGECLLAVRPEDFELVDTDAAVIGEVVDVIFTGGLIRLHVRAGDQEVVAALPSHGVVVPAVGDQTRLRPITKAARTVGS